ncbi:MAG: BTAD domain-containing putative transcriptional regulator [Meiothermus sp.]|nr:BTAD domain-containing putative transcriptional regulator [Meiothermus sp.]
MIARTAQASWQLQLLGGARLQSPRGEVRLQWRVAGILAYLALEGATPKYRLAGWLWPDSEESTARNNLRQALKRFRDAAGVDLIVGEDSIALAEWLEVDAVQLSAASFAGEYSRVATWEGELLEGLEFGDCPDFDEWLVASRESFAALRREAAASEADRLERSGLLAQALVMSRRAVELDPVSEEAHRRLMRLHYLLGDRGAALAAFERCREILGREFGAEPLPETFELARQIERGSVTGAKPSVEPIPQPKPIASSPLIGREREWALMEEAYQQGKLVFLRGEPGVGKTRLAMEFAASKGPVLVNTPRPGDRAVPFATYAREVRKVAALQPEVLQNLPGWVRLELSRLAPELSQGEVPAPIASDAEKIRLFDALAELNRAAQRGHVIVGDDAQYMDPATVEALVYILGKFGGVGNAALEFTIQVYRRDELDPAIEHNVVRSLVESGLAVLIDVEPLGTDAVRDLLAELQLGGLEQLAAQMTRFTGGNPLFVLETVRHLQETGQLGRGWPGRLPPPSKVGTVISQRLGKLSPLALNIARAAAILQSDFSPNLIARMLEQRPLELMEAWQSLEAHQILRGSSFVHDLIYETVLSGIAPTVGTVLHARAAEVQTEAGASPALIARHWMQAGEPAKAAPLFLEAADQANRAYRLTEEAELLEQAIHAFEQAGDLDRAFQTRIWAVESLWRHDSGPRQVRLIDQLLQTARTPSQKGEAWSTRAWWAISTSQYPQAEAAARAGLAALGDPELHPQTAGKLLRALCDALNNQGRYEEALQTLEQADQLLERSDDRTGLFFNALNHSNILYHLHRHAEVVAHNRKVLASLEAQGEEPNRVWRAEAMRRIASSQFYLAQYEQALEHAREAEAQLEGVYGVEHTHYEIVMEQGWALLSQERYAEALSQFRRAEAMLKPHESRAFLIEPLGALYRALGAWEMLEQQLHTTEQESQHTPLYRDLSLYHRAAYLTQRGQDIGAEQFAELEQRLEASGWDHGLALLRLVRSALLEPQEGLAQAQKSLEWARAKGIAGLETEALAYSARILLRLGRTQEALEHSAAALGRVAAYPPPWKRAVVWLARYEALRAAEDKGAWEMLHRAQDWIHHVAQNHVPEEFREGYLTRNPVNREIEALAQLWSTSLQSLA